MASIKHKVFISYHQDDVQEVENFIRTFDEYRDVFITRALGTEMDPTTVDSSDTSYVMRRIRELYLGDSTVTVVLIGECTKARRYVDWELQFSLRHGETVTPNGVIGINLPSVGHQVLAPPRLEANLSKEGEVQVGYARYWIYPSSAAVLAGWIDDAFSARTSRTHLIKNERARFINNLQCP